MRRELVTKIFHETFGGAASLWARAPGRVDLMGSHTDYNLGHVLTLPISRDTWIAARPRDDGRVRVWSAALDSGSSFSLDAIERDDDSPWSNYLRAVASVLKEEGLELRGFDGVIHSTVPIGSGLSSSAALECVTAVVFQALAGWTLEPARMARLCQHAENRFVGVSCGILDQYSSCLGRPGCALLLDCRDLETRPVPIGDGIQVVICDTRSKRELAGSEYGARRSQCEEGAALLGLAALREATMEQLNAGERELPSEVVQRCRFIIAENARVIELADALPLGNRAVIRRVCDESFQGARNLYEIVSPAMTAMMESMLAAPGVIGARQAGAGFGGCMVAFVEEEMTGEFGHAVEKAYQGATGLRPEIYSVEAAAGAGLIC